MLVLSLLSFTASAFANHGAPSDSERCRGRLEETETPGGEKHQILEELQEKDREISALRRKVSALEYELSLTKHPELSTGAAAGNTQELMLRGGVAYHLFAVAWKYAWEGVISAGF